MLRVRIGFIFLIHDQVIYSVGTAEERVYERFDMVRSKDRLDQWTRLLYSPGGDLDAMVNPAGETVQEFRGRAPLAPLILPRSLMGVFFS